MMSRREALTASLGAAAAAPFAARGAETAGVSALPVPHLFAPTDIAYLDNGSQHPISLGAKAAIDAYHARRMLDARADGQRVDAAAPLAKFARLINADPDEVAYVQSTTAGEQMILRALGLPEEGAHIVTDTLHFFGSLPLYEEMAKQGCDVTWLRPVDGRIRIADVRAALARRTKLVALSLVSTVNGFEHDLKAVCDLAHAAGALVYADIVHAAGCIPVDVKASGVDFAACASYKWLMGDFGLGFIYARKDVLPRLRRANYGYYGIDAFTSHVYPFDPPGDRVADYRFADDATGAFAIGTRSDAIIAHLDHSLGFLLDTGVERIQRHAQSLTDILKVELPRRGYALMTPDGSRTPLVTCALEDARAKLTEPMTAARVRLTISANRFRLTPSVQNGAADIDRFLAALPRA